MNAVSNHARRRDWALWLAGKGFAVFRCQVNSKKPLDNHTTDATCDADEVHRRWSDPVSGAPLGFNIGVATTGLLVVDVDNGPGKPGYESLAALGLTMQATFTVKTRAGGAHLYFRTDADIAGSVESIAPGIDIRAYHNYVIGPGSEIDGKHYLLENDCAFEDIPPAPPQILARCRPAGEKRERIASSSIELDTDSAIATAKLYLEHDAPTAIEGQGGDLTTFQVACEVRDRGISEGACLYLMLEWNDKKAHPPWSYEDLASKIRNCYRYAQRGEGEKNPARNFGAVNLEGLAKLLPKEPDPTAAGKAIWHVDGGDFNEAEIPRRPWIAPGYLLRGSVTAIVGPGGVSKSSLTIAWAVALALGVPCNKMEPLGSFKTLIYNVEDSPDEQRLRLGAALISMQARREDIAGMIELAGPAGVGTLLETGPNGSLQHTAAMVALQDRLTAFKPDVLVLDPLAELHSMDENSNIDLRKVIAEFRGLAEKHRCALVILHHMRKGTPTPGDADTARGASSIVSAARIALTVTSMAESDAKAFGLEPGAHRRFLRLDGAKANYSALSEAEWFVRQSHTLRNGDTAPAAVAWIPPTDVVTPEIMETIEKGIAEGSPTGEPWSAQLDSKPRSVRQLMVRAGINTLPGQTAAKNRLLAMGYTVCAFKDHNRKPAKGFKAPNGAPDTAKWIEDGDDGE